MAGAVGGGQLEVDIDGARVLPILFPSPSLGEKVIVAPGAGEREEKRGTKGEGGGGGGGREYQIQVFISLSTSWGAPGSYTYDMFPIVNFVWPPHPLLSLPTLGSHLSLQLIQLVRRWVCEERREGRERREIERGEGGGSAAGQLCILTVFGR